MAGASLAVAAVCTVLLMVSVAPVYRMQTNPAVEGSPPSPIVETSSKPSAVVDVPAQPQSTLAASQPCPPRGATGEAIKAQNIAPADTPTPAISTAAPDCAPTPGRTLADHPADAIEAIAARQRAEAARPPAGARDAAKVGAASADRSPNGGLIEVDRSAPAFGTKGRNIRTPAVAAPPAAPATPQASSAGQP